MLYREFIRLVYAAKSGVCIVWGKIICIKYIKYNNLYYNIIYYIIVL